MPSLSTAAPETGRTTAAKAGRDTATSTNPLAASMQSAMVSIPPCSTATSTHTSATPAQLYKAATERRAMWK